MSNLFNIILSSSIFLFHAMSMPVELFTLLPVGKIPGVIWLVPVQPIIVI